MSSVMIKCPSLWSKVPSLYHVIFGLGSPDAMHWNEAGEDWFTVILTGPASRETGTEIQRNQSEIGLLRDCFFSEGFVSWSVESVDQFSKGVTFSISDNDLFCLLLLEH